ncbi:hypothetical protein AB4Z22_06760 [Paenibacillus sp. TAF58]
MAWDSKKTDHMVQLYAHVCALGSTNGMVRSNGSHSQETNANEDDAGGNASLNIIMQLIHEYIKLT